MSDLSILQEQTLNFLNDPNQYIYSNEIIALALRFALLDYSSYNPRLELAVLTLSEDGHEIDLSSLVNIDSIRKVHFPWDSAKPYSEQETNIVTRWDFAIISGSARVTLETQSNTVPLVGDELRLVYTTQHTIAGLEGASVTTIPAAHLNLLSKGAVAYALLYTASNRADLLDKSLTERLAHIYMDSFHNMLNKIANEHQRNQAITSWAGMDKYERVY